MPKKHIILAALAMPLAFAAQAQNIEEDATDAAGLATSENQLSEAELPAMSDALVSSLVDVLSEMDDVEILQMEQTVTDTGTLDLDTDMVVENQITAALEEGLILPENPGDVEVVMAIVNANAEYFYFDILQEISDLIAEGEFGETQIRQTPTKPLSHMKNLTPKNLIMRFISRCQLRAGPSFRPICRF